ncbi:hypothetical protein RF11_03440 [Thelohanellus kitauei]|uniref:Retropepsins domain-containing protein n=1 Tax=Thelohanellus kitauei TaxID=669202 RepID=A0A0C2JBN6_THEKT|nr:hypothetical protein RF11_03440 [Thelohanellus kitauei]
MTKIGGGYEIDRALALRFDTVAAANMWDAAKQCLMMPAYFDEELLDSYSKSEIFLMPPSEKKLIHIKQWFSIQLSSKTDQPSSFALFTKASLRPSQKVEQFGKMLEGYISACMPGISQTEKDFMVREKIYQSLPVAVANQIRLFGEMEVKEVCAKADLLLGPTLSTNAISAESDATPEAEVAAIKSNIDSSLSVEERLSRIEDSIARISMSGTSLSKHAQPCKKCGSNRHDSDECLGLITCSLCKRKGHARRICPTLENSKQSKYYSRRYYCFSSFNQQPYPQMVDVIVEGSFKVKGLVDTGSCISLLNFSTLGHVGEIIPANKSIYSVTGQSIEVIGNKILEIEVNGKKITWEFTIVNKINHPLILGRDFLAKNSFLVDLMSPEILVTRDSKQKLLCDAVENADSIDSAVHEYDGVFSKSEDDLGFTDLIKHKIITENNVG